MRRFWTITAALALVRLLLAATVPLGDDEGYYWVWSRHLATGYYDHPPLVSWLVALSTRLLGVSLLGLRLPFVVLGTLAAAALRALVARTTGDSALADRSALVLQVVPVFFGFGLLVIPDTPLLAAWLLVALAAWRWLGGMERATTTGALAIGGALGLALTAKYVAVLLPLSLAGWLLAARRPRALGALAGAVAVAAVLFAPVIVWNARHDWASFRFQFAARHAGAGFDPDRLGLYLASQALYLSPLLFALTLPAALRLGPWRIAARDSGASFLWWMAAPTLGAFLVAGATTAFKPNWPAPGYVTLIPLVLRGLDRWRERGSRWSRPLARGAIGLAAAAVALAAAHLVRPFVPLPPGADPTVDGRGWPAAAASVARAAASLRAEQRAAPGAEAARILYAAGRYQVAARLEFQLPGHPAVLCLNPGRDAYDDWQRLDALRGTDFVFLATGRFPAPPAELVRVRESRRFATLRIPAGPGATQEFTIYVCRGLGEPARPPGSSGR